MRKKPEWTSCGGLVRCTKCGSDEMMMCDVRVRSGVSKRETKCEGCGDRITTKMEAPQLPAPASAPAPAPAPVEPYKAPKKGRAQAPVAAPVLPVEARRGPALELLDLDAIEAESIQPREQLDLFAVSDYAQQMKRGELGQVVDLRGDDWTPIVVYREPGVRGRVWLADGFHRVKAAREGGLVAFQAQVYAGTQRDALYHATGANARHGVRLTNADKRRVVTLQLEDVEWSKASDTEIAARCGVTQPFVSKLRGELRQRIKAAETAARAKAEREPITVMDEAPQFDLEEMIRQRQQEREAQGPLSLGFTLSGDTEIAGDDAAQAAEAKRIKQEQRDSWSTPPEFLERIVRELLIRIDLDPASNAAAQEVVQAARWFSAEDDGLAQEWGGRVWLNPPYSYPLVERFATKAIEEFKAGRIERMVVLVNSSTSSAWWHALSRACSVIAFPDERIAFWSPHGLDGEANRNSQTIFYFGAGDLFALNVLKQEGCTVFLNSNHF